MEKKKYRKPALKTWGTVQELTQSGTWEYSRDWRTVSGSRPRPSCTG